MRMCPEESDQDGEMSLGQDLQGSSELTWLVQLGEEKSEGWMTSFSRGEMEGEMLISSRWCPATGYEEME